MANSMRVQLAAMGYPQAEIDRASKAGLTDTAAAIEWLLNHPASSSSNSGMDLLSEAAAANSDVQFLGTNNPKHIQPMQSEDELMQQAIQASLDTSNNTSHSASITEDEQQQAAILASIKQSMNQFENGVWVDPKNPYQRERPFNTSINKLMPVGLKNTGNVCYFNSLIQMFFGLRPLVVEAIMKIDTKKIIDQAVNQAHTQIDNRSTSDQSKIQSTNNQSISQSANNQLKGKFDLNAPLPAPTNSPIASATPSTPKSTIQSTAHPKEPNSQPNNQSVNQSICHAKVQFVHELQKLFVLMHGSGRKYIDPSSSIDCLFKATNRSANQSKLQHDAVEWFDLIVDIIDEVDQASHQANNPLVSEKNNQPDDLAKMLRPVQSRVMEQPLNPALSAVIDQTSTSSISSNHNQSTTSSNNQSIAHSSKSLTEQVTSPSHGVANMQLQSLDQPADQSVTSSLDQTAGSQSTEQSTNKQQSNGLPSDQLANIQDSTSSVNQSTNQYRSFKSLFFSEAIQELRALDSQSLNHMNTGSVDPVDQPADPSVIISSKMSIGPMILNIESNQSIDQPTSQSVRQFMGGSQDPAVVPSTNQSVIDSYIQSINQASFQCGNLMDSIDAYTRSVVQYRLNNKPTNQSSTQTSLPLSPGVQANSQATTGTMIDCERQLLFTHLPPVITFQLQRVMFNSITQSIKKNNQRFCFDQVINMDRFMYANRQSINEKNQQIRIWKQQLQSINQSISQIISFGGSHIPLHSALMVSSQFLSNQSTNQSINQTVVPTIVQSQSAATHPNCQPEIVSINQTADQSNSMAILLAQYACQVEERLVDLIDQSNKINKSIKHIFDDLHEAINQSITQPSNQYILFGALIHDGREAGSGHYWCYLRRHPAEKQTITHRDNLVGQQSRERWADSPLNPSTSQSHNQSNNHPVDLSNPAQSADQSVNQQDNQSITQMLLQSLDKDQFYKFNDSVVTLVDQAEVMREAEGSGDQPSNSSSKPSSASAYFLIYLSVDQWIRMDSLVFDRLVSQLTDQSLINCLRADHKSFVDEKAAWDHEQVTKLVNNLVDQSAYQFEQVIEEYSKVHRTFKTTMINISNNQPVRQLELGCYSFAMWLMTINETALSHYIILDDFIHDIFDPSIKQMISDSLSQLDNHLMKQSVDYANQLILQILDQTIRRIVAKHPNDIGFKPHIMTSQSINQSNTQWGNVASNDRLRLVNLHTQYIAYQTVYQWVNQSMKQLSINHSINSSMACLLRALYNVLEHVIKPVTDHTIHETINDMYVIVISQFPLIIWLMFLINRLIVSIDPSSGWSSIKHSAYHSLRQVDVIVCLLCRVHQHLSTSPSFSHRLNPTIKQIVEQSLYNLRQTLQTSMVMFSSERSEPSNQPTNQISAQETSAMEQLINEVVATDNQTIQQLLVRMNGVTNQPNTQLGLLRHAVDICATQCDPSIKQTIDPSFKISGSSLFESVQSINRSIHQQYSSCIHTIYQSINGVDVDSIDKDIDQVRSIAQSIVQPVKATAIGHSNPQSLDSTNIKPVKATVVEEPNNQSINQSIDQSNNPSNNQSINQSAELTKQPTTEQTIITEKQATTDQPIDQTINPSINQSSDESMSVEPGAAIDHGDVHMEASDESAIHQ